MRSLTPLRLDFIHPRRRVAPAAVVLLGLGLLACVGVAQRLVQVTADLVELEAAAALVAPANPGRTSRPIVGSTASKMQALKAEQVNAALSSLSTPWDAWFVQLEAVADRKVVLMALQPEADGRRVRLSGEARQFDDLLAYMTRLEAAPGFANVFLSEHGEAVQGGVSFTLTADWVAQR
nr:PilN domain-containing protein [uncultured Roseateles sp.]